MTDKIQAAYSITRVTDGQYVIPWDRIPAISIDQVLWLPDAGIRAEGQLCYDDAALYVHMRAVEKNIRAEYTQPLSPVCNDSCLEFFFMIDGEENYFNFEINPNGCLCIQFGKKIDRIDIAQERSQQYFDISASGTPDGWEIFYRIPVGFIQLFYPGYRFDRDIRANMYKCGNHTVNKHFIAWAPIETEKPNFHLPEFFRLMSFGDC